jgi:hypothetical protein
MARGAVPLSSQDVHDQLREAFRRNFPSGNQIATAAVNRALVGRNADAPWIRETFSDLVERVQVDAYAEYLTAQEAAGSRALSRVFLPLIGENSTPAQSAEVFGRYFCALDGFFLSLTQGRRPRAGKVFELLIRELFTRLRYPFTSQPAIDGQPDFILPSVEHYHRNAPDVIIFTIKRTLRERWRQIVTEGARGLGFFLATIDEKIAVRDLDAMLQSRIYIVVPARIKAIRPDYQAAVNVITFEHFFEFHLDPAMQRWRAAGVVE